MTYPQPAECMALTVCGTERRRDLVLPSDVPICELIPAIAHEVGTSPAHGLQLSTLSGEPIAPDQNLSDVELCDGEVLLLHSEGPAEVTRVYDDPAAALAANTRGVSSLDHRAAISSLVLVAAVSLGVCASGVSWLSAYALGALAITLALRAAGLLGIFGTTALGYIALMLAVLGVLPLSGGGESIASIVTLAAFTHPFIPALGIAVSRIPNRLGLRHDLDSLAAIESSARRAGAIHRGAHVAGTAVIGVGCGLLSISAIPAISGLAACAFVATGVRQRHLDPAGPGAFLLLATTYAGALLAFAAYRSWQPWALISLIGCGIALLSIPPRSDPRIDRAAAAIESLTRGALLPLVLLAWGLNDVIAEILGR